MQKFITTTLLTLAFGLLTTQAQAQCAHDEREAEVIRMNPDYLQSERDFIDQVDFDQSNATEGTVYTIPVVVHVIYNTTADSISHEQIQDAISVLNEDYRRLNADAVNTRSIFTSVAADTEIEFQLAKLDPNGNCTTGITYTESALSVDAGNNVKSLISWNNKKYMNVWVVNSIESSSANGTILGYAYKPNPGQSTTYDGIVIRHDRMGRIGTSQSMGRTLTHESGHYFGLDHPFKGGCYQGDNCADTPPVAEASYGCNTNANTCSNDSPNLPDMIENYMDYADDNCMNIFTDDQKAIMRSNLANINRRGYLVTTSNMEFTGLEENQALPCAPDADFEASQEVLCANEQIQFFDISTFGNPTSWSWSFPGGTPSTSTDEHPVVTYSNKGNFDVSLTVTNAVGTTSKVHSGFISVRSAQNPMWVNNFISGFEFSDIPNGTWHVENTDNDNVKWKRITNYSYAGNHCVKLDNFNNEAGNEDAIISELIVVDAATSLDLNFRYAAASKPGNATDKMQILVSDDCGETWDLIRTIQGPLTYTALNKSNAWTPTASNQWRLSSTSLNDYAGGQPIMFKINVISGGGNNFYLDNFQIAATLGEDEFAGPKGLYPNPSNGSFIWEALSDGQEFRVSNLAGQLMWIGQAGTQGKVDVNLPKGMYMIKAEGIQPMRILIQ